MVQHIPAHITLSPKLQRLVHSTEAAGGTASREASQNVRVCMGTRTRESDDPGSLNTSTTSTKTRSTCTYTNTHSGTRT